MQNKYHNKKTTIDNIRFDSAKEAKRYEQLKLLQAAGEIRNLELQPRYDLVVNRQKIGFYKADFRYHDMNGEKIIEDVKGVRTPVYRLKKKLVKAIYGIDIIEI